MAEFTQKFRASQVQLPQPVSAFVQGQAARMAYEQSQIQSQIMQQQAQSLAYQNSPEVRGLNRRAAQTDIAYTDALTDATLNPAPKRTTKQIREGGDYVTYEYINGVQGQEIGRSSIQTGTAADPSLTERQGKGTAWYGMAQLGNEQLEKQLAGGGANIDQTQLYLYAKSIDMRTGPAARTAARAAISQENLNIFDAAYRLIEPIVRQNTGAAVQQNEYIMEWNSLVPMSDDPVELADKRMARERRLRGLQIESGYNLPPGTGNEPANPSGATATGHTATAKNGDKLRHMSDGTWEVLQADGSWAKYQP